VHSGRKGILLFTFFRKHDAGFLQQVSVAPGAQLRLSAWAHAWSNHKDKSHPERFPHPDDGAWSEGPGYEAGFCLEGEAPDDNWRNFTFYVGIDPTGGINPLADTVVWGRGAHIYNEHAQVPAVEATAQSDTVTVFLRSKTLWPFKHNDAYWDDAELFVVGEEAPEMPEVELGHWPADPKVGQKVTVGARCQTELSEVSLLILQPSGATLSHAPATVGTQDDWFTWSFTTAPLTEVGQHNMLFSAADGVEVTGSFEGEPADQPRRGTPRDQYDRTYVLLPPDADALWALAAVDAVWDDWRYTIGSSADDAGIGDLDVRRVIAVNPGSWPADLRAFFEEHYPEVEVVPVEADTPDELEQRLRQL
jgi:hypothetical protein